MAENERTRRFSLTLPISWKKEKKETKENKLPERDVYPAQTPEESKVWGDLPYCPDAFPEQKKE